MSPEAERLRSERSLMNMRRADALELAAMLLDCDDPLTVASALDEAWPPLKPRGPLRTAEEPPGGYMMQRVSDVTGWGTTALAELLRLSPMTIGSYKVGRRNEDAMDGARWTRLADAIEMQIEAMQALVPELRRRAG